MGVEPTQGRITAPQTVLKTAVVTGPRAAPLAPIFPRRWRRVLLRQIEQGLAVLGELVLGLDLEEAAGELVSRHEGHSATV